MDRLYMLMTLGSPILGGLLGAMALTLRAGRRCLLLPLGLRAMRLLVAWDQYQTKNLFWELGVLYSAAVGGAIFLGCLMGWRLCRRKEA